MKVTAVKFTSIVLDGSAANTLSQHFSNSFTHGPTNFPSITKLVTRGLSLIVILSITDSHPPPCAVRCVAKATAILPTAAHHATKRGFLSLCFFALCSHGGTSGNKVGSRRLLPTRYEFQLHSSLELASASNLGKGNRDAETSRASAAVNSLNIKGNKKRSDPESVLKVETVVVTGIKAGMFIRCACGGHSAEADDV